MGVLRRLGSKTSIWRRRSMKRSEGPMLGLFLLLLAIFCSSVASGSPVSIKVPGYFEMVNLGFSVDFAKRLKFIFIKTKVKEKKKKKKKR